MLLFWNNVGIPVYRTTSLVWSRSTNTNIKVCNSVACLARYTISLMINKSGALRRQLYTGYFPLLYTATAQHYRVINFALPLMQMLLSMCVLLILGHSSQRTGAHGVLGYILEGRKKDHTTNRETLEK